MAMPNVVGMHNKVGMTMDLVDILVCLANYLTL